MSELLEKFKTMKAEDLLTDKLKKVKNLKKIQEDLASIDATKLSERQKIKKILQNQLLPELEYIELLEKAIKEKDF